MQLLITFTVLSYLIVHLEASGLFRVYLISFRNPRSWDHKHRACDYFSPPCDTKFEIKLWSSTFPVKVIHTREYSSQDNVNFESSYNPITLHVSNYRGYMDMHVYVKDMDPIGYDKINSFSVRMHSSSPGTFYSATWSGDHGHTPLHVRYVWSCNSNYYGSMCNVYCSSTSRYYCNSWGNRVCRSGWLYASSYCITRNYCYPNPCKINGRCQNGRSGYSCSCINGYHGKHCEKSPYEEPCLKKPCLNGGCHELKNNTKPFKCLCPDEYTGDRCEIFVPICDRQQQPCLNQGKCIQDNSNLTYSCNCAANYTGFHCDRLKCGTLCYNGGRCNEINGTYQCVCGELYTGFNCMERRIFGPLPQSASEQLMSFNAIYIVTTLVVLLIITVLVVFILHKKRVINVGETYQRLRHNSVQFYENHFRRGSKQTEFHVNMTYENDTSSVYDEIQGDENNDNYYSTVHKGQNQDGDGSAHVIIEPTEGQNSTEESKEPNLLQTSPNATLEEDPQVVVENKNVYEDENNMNNIETDAEHDE